MLALLDADIFVYRVGFAAMDVDEPLALWRMDELIERCLYALNTKDYQPYITAQGKSCFRYDIFPDYKANRKSPKPTHYLALREHVLKKHKGILCEKVEADDQIALDCMKNPDSCIVTIDKDLDQVPGLHYNFVKDYSYTVSPTGAIRHFYWQCLVGDKSVDNIEGCPKIGPVKAEAALVGCDSEIDMLLQTLKLYIKAYDDLEEALDRLWLAGQLLWIRRNPADPEEGWTLNSSPVSKEMLLNISMNTGLDLLTKRTKSNTQSQNTKELIIQTSS